jgi:hypothetical protein
MPTSPPEVMRTRSLIVVVEVGRVPKTMSADPLVAAEVKTDPM